MSASGYRLNIMSYWLNGLRCRLDCAFSLASIAGLRKTAKVKILFNVAGVKLQVKGDIP
ncbi:hypothetical protein D3C75_1129240 [compost metagenome]